MDGRGQPRRRLPFSRDRQSNQTAADIHVVTNGDKVWFFRQEAPFRRVPRPDLVVLDLNLPFKNGEEVMVEWLPTRC